MYYTWSVPDLKSLMSTKHRKLEWTKAEWAELELFKSVLD